MSSLKASQSYTALTSLVALCIAGGATPTMAQTPTSKPCGSQCFVTITSQPGATPVTGNVLFSITYPWPNGTQYTPQANLPSGFTSNSMSFSDKNTGTTL